MYLSRKCHPFGFGFWMYNMAERPERLPSWCKIHKWYPSQHPLTKNCPRVSVCLSVCLSHPFDHLVRVGLFVHVVSMTLLVTMHAYILSCLVSPNLFLWLGMSTGLKAGEMTAQNNVLSFRITIDGTLNTSRRHFISQMLESKESLGILAKKYSDPLKISFIDPASKPQTLFQNPWLLLKSFLFLDKRKSTFDCFRENGSWQ